jgi:hypothetical protein
MQKKSTPQSAFFSPRILIALVVCAAACFMVAGTLLGFFLAEVPVKGFSKNADVCRAGWLSAGNRRSLLATPDLAAATLGHQATARRGDISGAT